MTESIRRIWMKRALLGLVGVVTAAGGPAGLMQAALAQDKFPARQIEMMVPWGPGGGADVLGRTIARWLEADLKVNVPVLNNAGAMGSIGLARMVATGGDGHAVGVMTADTWMMLATTPGAQLKTQDVVPLGVLVRQPSGIFVKMDSRFKTWQDVIDEARARPGVVSIAITGAGSPDEIAVNYLAKRSVNLLSAGFAHRARLEDVRRPPPRRRPRPSPGTIRHRYSMRSSPDQPSYRRWRRTWSAYSSNVIMSS